MLNRILLAISILFGILYFPLCQQSSAASVGWARGIGLAVVAGRISVCQPERFLQATRRDQLPLLPLRDPEVSCGGTSEVIL